MRKRIDTGTDIATIGLWDESRQKEPFGKEAYRRWGKSQERDADAGKIFLIQTGGDGGFLVDVYVEEAASAEVLGKARQMGGEFLLCVPSGRLVVGGAEDYRRERPVITGEMDVVELPPGDYRLRCFSVDAGEEEGEFSSMGEAAEKVLNSEDLAHFRKRNAEEKRVLKIGCLLWLLFPALIYPLGWLIALGVAAGVAITTFFVGMIRIQRQWRGDERWQILQRRVQEAWNEDQVPAFVIEMFRVAERGEMKGGTVHV